MVLVDALPLLYKAHFAFPPDSRLRSTTGVDTTVLYIVLNMLLNLLSLSPPPTHFAVVFDAAGKNFRCGWGVCGVVGGAPWVGRVGVGCAAAQAPGPCLLVARARACVRVCVCARAHVCVLGGLLHG
jgi:hypothetical protein